jgi:RNA polymerase sigma-70 factor (ECF subfamily)
MEQEDIKLMLELKDGDETAFEMLFEKYSKPVLNFVYKISGDYLFAKDIMEEVFYKLYKARKRYNPKSKFTTFLFTIAKNTTIEFLRKKRYSVRLDDALMIKQGSDNIGYEVHNAILQLALIEREILILRFYYHFNYNEIAQIVKIPQGTVKSRFFRIKEKLLEKLK